MTKSQREIFTDLYSLTNDMGIDFSNIYPVNEKKIIAFQKANSLVSKVIYHVLMDTPENDERENDRRMASEYLGQIKNVMNQF